MDIINNNPYRLLGVYSNSPTKERVANEGKLKAFLKVNRQVAFPLDLTQYLPSIKRTIDTPANAEARLTLPADQIKYAQFWFLNVTPVDKIAFRHLTGGDMDNAIATWDKATNVSSLQNRIVCYLIRKDYPSACRLAEDLYKRFASQFVSCVAGDNAKVPSSLAFDFLDTLSEELGTSTVLGSVSDAEWKKHISAKAVSPVIAKLQSAVDAAKATRGKGSQARYNAGVKLMNGTKSDLAQLKTLLPTTDLQYQMIADKISQEILQCGIGYLNGADQLDAPQKTKQLLDYALSIAIGKMAKDRIQENLNILRKIGKEYIVSKELSSIQSIIINLRSCSPIFKQFDSHSPLSLILIDSPGNVLGQEIKHGITIIKTIKEKLGAGNTLYIQVSSAFVSSAVNAIVYIVNEIQAEESVMAPIYGASDKLKATIEYALNMLSELLLLGMDDESKDYFDKTYEALRGIDKKLNPEKYKEHYNKRTQYISAAILMILSIIVGLIIDFYFSQNSNEDIGITVGCVFGAIAWSYPWIERSDFFSDMWNDSDGGCGCIIACLMFGLWIPIVHYWIYKGIAFCIKKIK